MNHSIECRCQPVSLWFEYVPGSLQAPTHGWDVGKWRLKVKGGVLPLQVVHTAAKTVMNDIACSIVTMDRGILQAIWHRYYGWLGEHDEAEELG